MLSQGDFADRGSDEAAANVPTESLRATEQPVVGIPTRELLRLAHEGEIAYVMVEGIAHFPVDVLEDYRATAG